jgi:hypothetical protein
LLLNAAWLVEKQKISILVFDFTQQGLKPMIYCTQGGYAKHYTTMLSVQYINQIM